MTRVPWGYSIPTSDDPGVLNEPSPEGEELGRAVALAVTAEEQLRKPEFPDQHPRCDDCAGRLGTFPNRCLPTLGDLIKCVAENRIFWCHKGFKEGEQPKRPCVAYLHLVSRMGRVEAEKRKARNARKRARRARA